MKTPLILISLTSLFLVSCGKTEEVKIVENPSVMEKRVIASPSITEVPTTATGDINTTGSGKIEGASTASENGAKVNSGSITNSLKEAEGNIYQNKEILINLFENFKVSLDDEGKEVVMFGPLGPDLGPIATDKQYPIYEFRIKEKLSETDLIKQIKEIYTQSIISGPSIEKIDGLNVVKWTAGGMCEERSMIILGVQHNYRLSSVGCFTDEKSDFDYFIKAIQTLKFLK